jgi:hypothetical protein
MVERNFEAQLTERTWTLAIAKRSLPKYLEHLSSMSLNFLMFVDKEEHLFVSFLIECEYGLGRKRK